MAGKQIRGLDLIAAGLIVLVCSIVIYEEFLGWFLVKPIGGSITLVVVGILGYLYFSR